MAILYQELSRALIKQTSFFRCLTPPYPLISNNDRHGVFQTNFNVIFATILQSQILPPSYPPDSAKHFSSSHQQLFSTRLSIFHIRSKTKYICDHFNLLKQQFWHSRILQPDFTECYEERPELTPYSSNWEANNIRRQDLQREHLR